MKKLLLSAAFGAALLLAPTSSQAVGENNVWPQWYIGTNLGVAFNPTDVELSGSGTSSDVEVDTGYSSSALIGYRPRFNKQGANNIRLELEYARRNNDAANDGGKLISDSLHLSGIYDFKRNDGKNQKVVPYVGLGFGGSDVEVFDSNSAGITDNKEQVLSALLQAGLGFDFKALPHVEFQIGWKALALLESPTLESTAGDIEVKKYFSNSVEAGVRFRF